MAKQSEAALPHLMLFAEDLNLDRRKLTPNFGGRPHRGTRKAFAGALLSCIEEIVAAAEALPAPPAGIQPHLVFRVPLAPKASPHAVIPLLARMGINVVGIDVDNAVIAFHHDSDLVSFKEAIAAYAAGPKSGINEKTEEPYKTTQWDGLEWIEPAEMRAWSRADRIGIRLAAIIGADAEGVDVSAIYVVDIELWHRGTNDLAVDAVTEVRTVINARKDRLTDSFEGELLCLARASVKGSTLIELLDLPIVAEIDIPAQPIFDRRAADKSVDRDFPPPPRPPADGPSVCVVDSGINSGHPLLANNFGKAEAILTTTDDPSDEAGHGTMVGAIACFGDVRACYGTGEFSSPITLYSARVLNAANKFDDERLIIHQMERAVELFSSPPYNCRVFNLSLGYEDAWLADNQRQSLWAESLDILARKHKVLFVVSAGNQNKVCTDFTEDAERVLASYPEFFFDNDWGLADPATAAIPITVGGIAQFEQPSVPEGVKAGDIFRVIANSGEPLPISRIGPGLNDAIKPEFVAPGGNVAFQGFSSIRRIDDEPGIAAMSFSHEPLNQLFAYGIGTSLAAPVVARQAALLWPILRDYLGEEPEPNIVRAVLAASATPPRELERCIRERFSETHMRRVCGYGLIDEARAQDSLGRRVTLLAQDTIPIDTFAVYEVPAPIEFREAPRKKFVTVALAFDPPVRRRRAEYLGVKMEYSLIRGKTLEEVKEACRALTTEEREAQQKLNKDARDKSAATKTKVKPERVVPGAIQGSCRCDLKPGPAALKGSTLQRSEFSFTREGKHKDYGSSWYLVLRAQRTWAPETITQQPYGLCVVLEAQEPRLYNLVQQRIQLRQRERARRRS